MEVCRGAETKADSVEVMMGKWEGHKVQKDSIQYLKERLHRGLGKSRTH